MTHYKGLVAAGDSLTADLVREVRLQRDPDGLKRLVLTTPAISVGSRQLVATLAWQRVT